MPKAPSRGRGQDEECIQKRKHTRRMSGGAPPSPNQALKNQRDTPGRVTNWTGPPHHKKLREQRTQENGRTRHFRTRTLRIEIQSVKGRDGQTPTRRQGDIHANRKGRCQEQRPDRYARNQNPRPHPRERREAENLRHPERTPAAHTRKSDFRKSC